MAWALLFAVWTVAVVAVTVRIDPRLKFTQWIESQGYLADLDPYPLDDLRALPALLIDAAGDPGVPVLSLHIEFTDLERLREERFQALERGVLIQGDDDYVRADVELAGRMIPARIRLKGDWTDQLENGRWSFRVHVKNDDQVLGMRRFSLHHPAVRDYHGEALFMDFMRGLGVLAPRYQFVDVRLNGESLGRMALEEHFSKELLESQGRRESVILKFNEDPVWLAQDGIESLRGFGGVFDNFKNAEIDSFESGRVMRDPVLSDALDVGTGLLRAFTAGTLPASQVFDPELLAKFVAGSEAWGAWHALRWHNLRFYFNPVSARLEPIAFDANVGHPYWYGRLSAQREPFVAAVLEDTLVQRLYVEELRRIRDEFPGSDLQASLEQRQNEYVDQLRGDYLLVRPFDLQRIANRANGMLSVLDGAYEPLTRDVRLLAHVYWEPTPAGVSIEVSSAVPQALEVLSVRWSGEAGEALAPVDDAALPARLAETPMGGTPRPTRIEFRATPPDSGSVPLLTIRRAGAKSSFVVAARQYPQARSSRPIPEASIDALLERYPFLSLDADAHALEVRPGAWTLSTWLATPPGYGLHIEPGTTLRFGADAGMVIRGPTRFRGTAEEPVRLEAAAGSAEVGWPGIFVLDASERSEWTHVVVRDTRGVGHAGWSLTGGVTFSRSPVRLESTAFLGNRAEDALNLIHSDFELDDITIVDAVSDGVDADFADGVIRSGRFERIGERGGGDAIDVSGSEVTIDGADFLHVGDKAVSVGEGARVTARNLVVQSALAGVVAKDGSEARVENSTFRDIGLAVFMTYVKKPEFGPATLTADGTRLEGRGQLAVVQTGCDIVLDGERVAAADLDVDELYATVMQRGTAQ